MKDEQKTKAELIAEVNALRQQVAELKLVTYWREELQEEIQQLEKSKQLLMTVVDTTPDWIFAKDRTLRWIFANKSVADALGTTPQEMIGKRDLELGFSERQVFGDPKTGWRGFWADDQIVLAGQTIYRHHDAMLGVAKATGHRFDTYKIPLRDDKGRIFGIVGFARDVTELTQTEAALQEQFELVARFKALVEATSDYVSYSDLEGNILYTNPAGMKLIGRPDQDPTQTLITDYVTLEVADKIYHHYLPIVLAKGLWSGETSLLHRDGTLIPISQVIVRLDDGDGVPIGFGTINRDITSQKEAAEALREAKEAAESANRAKSIFLANMSHELRTPLNGILGYTQILQRDRTLTDRQQRAIDIIQQSGEHLLTLLNDILDLSKIEAGHLEVVFGEFHLLNFLQDIADIFQVRTQQKDIWFVFEPAPQLPIGVQGDERRLRQVLINLLGNAVKFTESGGVTFKVSCHAGRIRFHIEDTGPGIKPEDIEAIFTPFQQVGDRQKMFDGTGLGLPISKKLVELMGGQLQIDSQVGQGSTFWFEVELPSITSWIAIETPDLTVVGYEGPAKKILVVDDNPDNRSVLLNMLQPLGFDVAEAEDGERAVKQVLAYQPDLILMDLVMPGIDGFEATQLIRQLRPTDLVIVAISASAFSRDQRKSFEVGCDAFLAKPFRLAELLREIGNHLHLQWLYKPAINSDTSTSEPSADLTLPPPEKLQTLYELARRGKIKAIQRTIAKLGQEDKAYQGFVDEIGTLANRYQMTKIRNLLESYVKNHA